MGNIYHGTAARFYYHTLDMSDYAEQIEQQLSRTLAEYRPLSGAAIQRVSGHRSARITLTGGALDSGTGANDAHVWARLQEEVGRVWAFLPYGDAFDRSCYCGQAVGENHQRIAGDDVVRLPVAMVSTDGIDRCVILWALSTGGTSPGSTHNGGAASANGGAAYLICTAISGTSAQLTVTFEHSTNGVDWDDLVVMTPLTAVGSECKEVGGTVRQYLRVSWVLSGISPSATWFAAFGRR